MSTTSIPDWLNNLPSFKTSIKDLAPSTTRKRCRPLTPDSTDIDMPRKSQRPEDQDATPRAKRLQLPDAESNYSLTSGSSASTKSGSQSPQKQIRALRNAEDGIDTRELSALKDPSPSLKAFIKKMKQVAKGRGMLSPSVRDAIAGHSNEDVAELDDDFYFSSDRDLLGHTPSLEEVTEIHQAAAECQGYDHAETTWNSWVHSPVLRLALKDPGSSVFRQIVGYMPCSTASILPDYLPSLKIAKKVDFCIYIDPAYDQKHSGSSTLISSMCDRMVDGSINHTDYTPLAERPLAVSIETKKLGENWNKATLQMSVSQAAQWNLIHEITVPGTRPNEALDYIPGIIIQGHNWFLVITTREGKKTVFWNKLDLGATDTIEGIYKLVYGLQVLREWARETYWPAFRNRVSSNIDAYKELLKKEAEARVKAQEAAREAAASGREVVLPS
ncbi:uncharacterized protein FRV6_16950 [Fusarium oxysporum]|uniref:PD-(D/E)XK nuclease-like domain-containing protein n=1 Tax=Fusarium oxysporum TaxID=5507 RepID=A0A2H3TW16_FUSOX|nr:uncharacterized protein FRV6_16950 [Fusarium oxysporum]